MRWLALILGILFCVAGIKALVAYDAATATLSRPVLLLISATGAALFFFLFAKANNNTKQLSEFERWLGQNANAVLSTGANYKGALITSKTEMTQFLMTVSFIVITLKLPSRHYVAGRDNIVFAQLSCTLATLLLGWWGIPWGPIYTVQTLVKNLSGGDKTTVGDYLNGKRNA